MSVEDQKRYRYIVSLEGYDVATNLKWIMNSNSLCLMPGILAANKTYDGSTTASLNLSGAIFQGLVAGANGGMQETGNPFDFAVKGNAWFGIQTPSGTIMTRDGRFSMNQNGELLSIEGHPVLDAGGAPIQLDPRGGPPKVGADGALHQGDRQVGAIGLFTFDPGVNFTRYGNSGSGIAGRAADAIRGRSGSAGRASSGTQ